MEVKSNHYYFIDYLRIFGMICVVFLHEAGVAVNRLNTSLDFEALNVFESIVYSAVPLFFMISGFLLLSDESTRDVGKLLRKRLPKLIIPLAFWTLATCVWNGHLADDYSLSGLVSRLLPALQGPVVQHFWFMYTLIAIYALSPLLVGVADLDSHGRIYFLVIIAVLNLRKILYCFLPDDVYDILRIDLLDKLEFFSGNLCTFMLGYYLGRIKKKIPNVALVGASLALVLIITLGSRSFYYRNGFYDPPFHCEYLGLEVFLAGCVFLLFKQNLNNEFKLPRLLRVAPKLTFAVYLMHVITMEFSFAFGMTPNSFIKVFMFSPVNYLLCLLLAKVISMIRPLCYIATGLTYNRF